MGLVVNQPASEIGFPDLLRQLDIAPTQDVDEIRVRVGGPVDHGRGFVLHSADYNTPDSTLEVDEIFSMTATLDILDAIATGKGPTQTLITLGYSGWAPGQLESEIVHNGWLTGDASADLIFSENDSAKWERALGTLGIDPLTLSAAAGRA